MMRLLDDGVDPLKINTPEDRTNILHAYFDRQFVGMDHEVEAPLLKRFLDAGVDINLYSRRFGWPLTIMVTNVDVTDEQLIPFYDVIFSGEYLDLNAVGPRGLKMGDMLADPAGAKRYPELSKRARAYTDAHGWVFHEEA